LDKLDWLAVNFSVYRPEPLVGSFGGLFKLRIGDWRVVYSIDYKNETLIVLIVDHRSKIYKRR